MAVVVTCSLLYSQQVRSLVSISICNDPQLRYTIYSKGLDLYAVASINVRDNYFIKL